jgi:hypothetical protein
LDVNRIVVLISRESIVESHISKLLDVSWIEKVTFLIIYDAASFYETTTRVNTGSREGKAVPAPHVAPVVVLYNVL